MIEILPNGMVNLHKLSAREGHSLWLLCYSNYPMTGINRRRLHRGYFYRENLLKILRHDPDRLMRCVTAYQLGARAEGDEE